GDKEAKMVPELADARVPTSTAVEWYQTSGGMKEEALRDQTVTSHKGLFTKAAHTPPPPPNNASVHPKPDSPQVPGPGPGRQR
ncbi:hypothetical protein GOODEAATRI_033514, partial [Goodea atripinnis]